MKEDLPMRTSILALVLSMVAPVMAQAQSLTWQTDYVAAQERAAAQRKPLAVVFGQGAGGWQQLGGGSLANAASDILAEKYVTCYVDTATPAGRAIAQRFEITSPVGLVISDRDASVQAFWHQGLLPADVLTGTLTRYADPQRSVTRTETNPGNQRTSNYPMTSTLGGLYGPVQSGMTGYVDVSPHGSASCPTCSPSGCSQSGCSSRGCSSRGRRCR
jgi:hypothetical protein